MTTRGYVARANATFGDLACREFYDRTLAKCPWRTSFTEETVLAALDTLVDMGWTPPAHRAGSVSSEENP